MNIRYPIYEGVYRILTIEIMQSRERMLAIVVHGFSLSHS